MKYTNVCLESFGYALPDEIVTTAEIEQRLEPLYRRLNLPTGRLELMTGIVERRFWPKGTLPGDISVGSGGSALAAAGLDPSRIGALVHGSVCRDYLEPATASGVHHRLHLPSNCLIYDVSNACLGLMNGLIQVANMIQLDQIEAGLIVGTECGRDLVENTIETLNRDESLSRDDVKRTIASLTIGSGSCAMLLTHADISQTQNRIMVAVARANTDHHRLCHSTGSDHGVASDGRPLMETDSEKLMHEGVATGRATLERFLAETGWDREDVDKTVCHQVGVAHRKLMFRAFELDPSLDFPTVQMLGNTGSVALPITMAIALHAGHIDAGDRVAMMGIGSGINCVMVGVEWQKTLEPHGERQATLQSIGR